MDAPGNRYQELAEKWMKGTITEAEKKEFSDWYNASMDEELVLDESVTGTREEMQERILQRIESERLVPARRRIPRIIRYAAAAAILIAIVGTLYLVQNKKAGEDAGIVSRPASAPVNDIAAPQISKAVLTMADGRKIYLDSAGTGTLATIGATNISRQGTDELVYAAKETIASQLIYNTLTVPRGSKVVNLTLSDGTKVWLNAESSLRFPVLFNSSERRVTVTGEAYFEVAKEKLRSFFVECNDFTTEVLGTHFNINAYADEQSGIVSLLEGSVKVSKSGKAAVMLSPGQQAETSFLNKTPIPDAEAVIAWKDGLFNFRNANIEAIMRQLARWYNLSVRYEGSVKEKHFTGRIGREESVAEVLHLLELTDVIHFKIEGREVIISP
jgi:transmembrane sensor